jgi:Peptidase A4 family
LSGARQIARTESRAARTTATTVAARRRRRSERPRSKGPNSYREITFLCFPVTVTRTWTLIALAALLAAALAAPGAPARLVHATRAAAASTEYSSNWAGYAVTGPTGQTTSFTSVTGTWTQSAATCGAGSGNSASAVWVGLGGYDLSSQALEQIGTDADCTSAGHARYSTWFELLPAAPVGISIRIRPGDLVSASVTVKASHVTLRIRDLTTAARFTRTLRAASVDGSSAEWIVEAPSSCASANSCRTLPLADFGTVSFSSATATAAGHTAAIGDPSWSATALELRQALVDVVAASSEAPSRPTSTLVLATPSAAAGASGAFSVDWHEQAVASPAPSGPTLPGFSGGSPS